MVAEYLIYKILERILFVKLSNDQAFVRHNCVVGTTVYRFVGTRYVTRQKWRTI